MGFFQRKSGSTLAIDILDTEVRMAVARGGEGTSGTVEKHASAELAAGIVKNGHLQDAAKFSGIVKAVSEKLPKGFPVSVALPPQTTFTAFLQGLKEAPKNKAAVQEIAEEWFPFPPQELAIENMWTPSIGSQGSLFLCGVELKVLEQYKNAFKNAGMTNVKFFPRTIAMVRAAFGPQGATRTTILLDLSIRPMVLSCIKGSVILDERLLFGEKVDESYCETLQSWLHFVTAPEPIVTPAPAPAKTPPSPTNPKDAVPAQTPAAKPAAETAPATPPPPPEAPRDTSFHVRVVGANPLPFDPHCAKLKGIDVAPELASIKEPQWAYAAGLAVLMQSKSPVPTFS